MDSKNKRWFFLTEYIPLNKLRIGDIILHDNGDIDEVVCFSGLVLILKPLINENNNQVNRCYLWNIEHEKNKLIQIIKENGN